MHFFVQRLQYLTAESKRAKPVQGWCCGCLAKVTLHGFALCHLFTVTLYVFLYQLPNVCQAATCVQHLKSSGPQWQWDAQIMTTPSILFGVLGRWDLHNSFTSFSVVLPCQQPKLGIASPNCVPIANHADVIWTIGIQVVQYMQGDEAWASHKTRHTNMITPMPFAPSDTPSCTWPMMRKNSECCKRFEWKFGPKLADCCYLPAGCVQSVHWIWMPSVYWFLRRNLGESTTSKVWNLLSCTING